MPVHEVYQHLLENNEEFQETIRGGYLNNNSFTWNDYLEFVANISHFIENSDQMTDTEDEMWGCYNDTEDEVQSYNWILSSGHELSIKRITHDVDESRPCVIGTVVFTNDTSETPHIPLSKITEAAHTLQSEDWNDIELYIVQDDCACCS